MIHKSYTVEIITPTIIGGADSKTLDPYKIRTSEIKSAMRQVFRMVAGKYIDHSQSGIKTLLEKEGEIFGSTSGKSSFKIWTEGTENLKTAKVKLLPHKSNFSKDAVLPNQRFKINILTYRDDFGVEFYKSMLRLTLLFGVGNRKNRLMGSMRIVEEPLNAKQDLDTVSSVCQEIFNSPEKNIPEPLFPTLSMQSKEKNQKNYIFLGVPLKKEYTGQGLMFETLLKDLYTKLIEPVMKSQHRDILGSANPRQGSYLNFSIYKDTEYKIYMVGFYYKNSKFNRTGWEDAIKYTRELYETNFKQ